MYSAALSSAPYTDRGLSWQEMWRVLVPIITVASIYNTRIIGIFYPFVKVFLTNSA